MVRKPKDKTLLKNKVLTIFDWLKEIQVGKRSWSSFSEEDKESFNCFMVNKFLSMNRNYIELVNYVQFIPYDKEKYYTIYKEMIPTGYVYSPYIKSKEISKSKELIEKIALYFECSKKEAGEYLCFLKKENIEEILVCLGTDEKEHKKLLKEL